MNEKKDYTGYEYKQVTTDRTMESLWRDSMENFGWMADRSEVKIVKRMPFALWIMAAPLSLLPWRHSRSSLATMLRTGKWKLPSSVTGRYPKSRS